MAKEKTTVPVAGGSRFSGALHKPIGDVEKIAAQRIKSIPSGGESHEEKKDVELKREKQESSAVTKPEKSSEELDKKKIENKKGGIGDLRPIKNLEGFFETSKVYPFDKNGDLASQRVHKEIVTAYKKLAVIGGVQMQEIVHNVLVDFLVSNRKAIDDYVEEKRSIGF